MTVTATMAGLRRWAAGSVTDTAAVELLALAARGRLVGPACPWVRPCARLGWFSLDAVLLAQLVGRLPGRDRHLVGLVVALLADGQPVTSSRQEVAA